MPPVMLVDIDGALLVGVEADSVCDDEQPATRAAALKAAPAIPMMDSRCSSRVFDADRSAYAAKLAHPGIISHRSSGSSRHSR
jgi:hypothetical protein